MKKRKSDDAAKCYELNKKKKQAAVWATVFTYFVESICTDEDNSIRAEERKFSRLCWKSHVSFLTPKEFKRVYRLSEVSFNRLLRLIWADIYTDPKYLRRCVAPVSPELRLAMTLRYLAGGNNNDIWVRFGVSESEMYRSIWKTVDAINKAIPIKTDFSNNETLESIERGFAAKSSRQLMRGCIGAIDGIQIKRHNCLDVNMCV